MSWRDADPNKWVKMEMPEWRDGQPGCKGCYDRNKSWTILEIGMLVYFHKFLYYCLRCGNRLRRKRRQA